MPQVPLTEWGYGKHGTTYTACAENLYATSAAFKRDMDRFVSDSKGKDQATFNAAATASLLSHVEFSWISVQMYYEQPHILGTSIQTLYEFIRGTVASAAMKEISGQAKLVLAATEESVYAPIAQYFVSGSGALLFDDYVYDTHSPFTYYTAVKYSLFN